MSVRKFNLNEENYRLAKDFLNEVGFPNPEINHEQMVRMHEISTILGTPSSPGACPTCNRKAYQTLTAYVYHYEGLEQE